MQEVVVLCHSSGKLYRLIFTGVRCWVEGMLQPEDMSALRNLDGGPSLEALQKCSSRSPMAKASPTLPRTRKVQEGVPATARGKRRRLEAWEDKRDQQMVDADAGASDASDPYLPFACLECEAVCFTARGLRSHRARVHAYRHPARLYASGSYCPSCVTQFHTRPRLLVHLKYTKVKCLRQLMALRTPLDNETVIELDRADERERQRLRRIGESQWRARIPSIRLSGPPHASTPEVA